MKRAAPALMVVLSLLIVVVPAQAQDEPPTPPPSGGCSALTANGTSCNLAIEGPGVAGNTSVVATNTSGPQYSYFNSGIICNHSLAAEYGGGVASWIALGDVIEAINFLASFGYAPGSLDEEDEGSFWVAELIGPDGPTNTGLGSCVGNNEPPPGRPPQPPQPGEVWGSGILLEPELRIDPAVRGLTGLQTYLWNEQATYVATTLPPLRGYTIEAEIWAVEWQWDMGSPDRDGNQTYAVRDQGSADQPAIVHTFSEANDVSIAHSVVWVGQYTLTHPQLAAPVVVDLGSAVITEAVDYDVIEIRAPNIGEETNE